MKHLSLILLPLLLIGCVRESSTQYMSGIDVYGQCTQVTNSQFRKVKVLFRTVQVDPADVFERGELSRACEKLRKLIGNATCTQESPYTGRAQEYSYQDVEDHCEIDQEEMIQ